jgi:disulfide bond formation protein DsbB
MSGRVLVYLNSLGLLGLSAALGYALADQIINDDLPCPLCLLQRVAMFGVGIGLVLNIAVAHHPRHYGMMIISAVLGMFIAMRQILLHIVPGTGAFGDPFLGLHFYTWAFILFVGVIAGASLVLVLVSRWDGERHLSIPFLGTLAIGTFFLLAVANVVGTMLECGVGACPDDPTSYEFLDRLLGFHNHK